MNTEQLIATLSADTSQVNPARLSTLCARWISGFALYAVLLVAYTGVRADLAQACTHPLFLAEIAILVSLILSAGMSAALLSLPDRNQRNTLSWLPLPIVAALILVIALSWMNTPSDMPDAGHGMECLICICAYALVPGAWLLWRMRRMATTHPAAAGSVAVIAAFSTGALALRLFEPTDSMMHVALWHYLPMLGIAIAGLGLGKCVLKW